MKRLVLNWGTLELCLDEENTIANTYLQRSSSSYLNSLLHIVMKYANIPMTNYVTSHIKQFNIKRSVTFKVKTSKKYRFDLHFIV